MNAAAEVAPTVFRYGLAEVGAVGEALAKQLLPGKWLFLDGDLGAGKTTLTQSVVVSLGGPSHVTSPTFAIMNVISLAGSNTLLHLDLYRIKSWRELSFLGLEQHLTPSTRVIVEWAELLSSDEWEELQRLLGFSIEGLRATITLEAERRTLRLVAINADASI